MEKNLQSRKDVVRLVQKLYNSPLNPEAIRPVSSIMVVPINSDLEPSVLDISEVTELKTTPGGEESVVSSSLIDNGFEDSIIFVQPNSGSKLSNPDHPSIFQEELQTIDSSVEDNVIFVQSNIDGSNLDNPDACTLQEELQSMETREVSHWLEVSEEIQIAGDENSAIIVMDPNEKAQDKGGDFTSPAKWKHCKQYQGKKNKQNKEEAHIKNQKDLLDLKKKLSVSVSYINVQNNSTLAESGDPMSRLVAVDESRSLMTQEYVSSVLSALDTDLSYSAFDRDNTVKQIEAAVSAPVSPRQRDYDSPPPEPVILTKRFKRPKPVAVVVNVAPRVHQIIQQRLSSPPPLVPFGHPPLPEFRIENPRTVEIQIPETAEDSNTGMDVEEDRAEEETREEYPVKGETSEEYPAEGETSEEYPAEGETSEEYPVEEQTVEDSVRWQSLPDNLCRVCAKTCDSLEYVFSEKGQALQLADLVHTHLPIMVTPDDLLPTHICTSCISRLQAADSLVRTCMEADSTLRGLLDLTQNTQVQLGETNTYDNVDDDVYDNHDREDNLFADENEVTYTANSPEKSDKSVDFSSLLSQDDVSLINKMKGDGLKVTLVRVPNLNDLPEEQKHQRVLQVLRTMNMSKCFKKKPVGSLSSRSGLGDPTSRETANISPVDDLLQDISASSALRDHETDDISPAGPLPINKAASVCSQVSEAPDSEPPIIDLGTVPAIEPSTSSQLDSTFKSSGPAADISISSDVPSLLRSELLDGINYAIKQGHVAKTGSIIKLNCKPDESSPSPSSVYVYVRNKDTQVNPQQIPRKILDLDVLHEHQMQQQKSRERKAAVKAAKHQASMIRRRARVREKRRMVTERRTLTCDECGLVFANKEAVVEHRRGHLKCRFCEKQFSKKPLLVEHERVHTKEKPFICDQCGRPFRTRSQMAQHAQRHNTDCPYMCQICGKQFSVRNTYLAHVTRHSSDAPYLCEMCGKCFKVQVALRLHRLTHRSFHCNLCDKVFSYRSYQIHKRTHAGEDSKFPCTYCYKKFLTVHRLKIHMLIHEATYPFSCSLCKRSFKRMTHLQAHQARHPAEQLQGVAFFCCAICQVQFEQPSQLSQHLKTHTEEERQSLCSFKCNTCNKCFSLEHELRTHELRHAGKQTFSCSTCNGAFDTKKEFDEHSDTHTEEKPFACEVCGKRFRALMNLNNHQQIHLSFKPYPCSSCPKAFKTVNGLNQHKVVHSDVRKHTCSMCSMGFKRRDAMKNHERTHFEDRPYACSICGRAFKVKADCSTHLKRHREAGIEGTIMESWYSCPVCSATFTLKSELTSHVQKAHDLEVAVLDKDDNLVLVPDPEIL